MEPQLADLSAEMPGVRLAEVRSMLGQQADEKSTRPKSRSVRPDSQDRTSGSISTSYKLPMHQMLYASDAIAKPGSPGSHGDNIGSTYTQVSGSVGLTSHHANRPILIEGDPLPVSLRRSRAIRGSE